MSANGTHNPLRRRHANGRNQRVSPVAPRRREGPLTEPTAAVRHRQREPLFMPQSGHCEPDRGRWRAGWCRPGV
jgi:hypothetical protein